MTLFIGRLQNGNFSAVSAASSEEVMELFDEVSNVEIAELFTTNRLMEHFKLTK